MIGRVRAAGRDCDGVARVEADWNLVVACDLPYLTREWLEYLLQRARDSAAEAVVPMNRRRKTSAERSRFARCTTACEPTLRRALERGMRKVTDGWWNCAWK